MKTGTIGSEIIKNGHTPPRKFAKASADPKDEFKKASADVTLPDIPKAPKSFSTKNAGKILMEGDSMLTGVINEAEWEVIGSVYSSVEPVYDPKNNCTYVGIEEVPTTARHKRHLTSIDNDGKVRWKYTDEEFQSGAALDKDGNVYFCTKDGVMSLDSEGNKRWKVPVEDQFYSDFPPVVSPDGSVYTVAHDYGEDRDGLSRIIAIKDGKIKWDYKTRNGFDRENNSIVVDKNGNLFIQAKKKIIDRKSYFKIFQKEHTESFFISLNPQGKERFRIPVKSWGRYSRDTTAPDGHIALDSDGNVITIQETNRVVKYDPEGNVLFDTTLEKQENNRTIALPSLFPPETDEQGNIYISSFKHNYIGKKGFLICLDKQGNQKWRKTVDTHFLTKPNITPQGDIAISSRDGHVHIYDKKGNLKKKYELGGKERIRRATGKTNDRNILWSRNNFVFDKQGKIIVGASEMIMAFDLKKDPYEVLREESPKCKNIDRQGVSINVEEKKVVIDNVELPIRD